MKNTVVIFLVSVLLAQGLAPLTRQLAKIPVLVTHFYAHHDHAHHEHGDDLTFFDFLGQHYGGRAHHDNASQEHSDLPFRCADGLSATLLVLLPSGVSMPVASFPAPGLQSKSVFGSIDFHSRLFGQAIFRPPLG